jgi:uncharacterized protein HemX
MMKSQLNLRTLPWHLIVIFLLLAIGIGTSGYFYYKDQKEDIKKAKTAKKAKTEELSALRIGIDV